MRKVFTVAWTLLAAGLVFASSASAALPACEGPIYEKTICSDQGVPG